MFASNNYAGCVGMLTATYLNAATVVIVPMDFSVSPPSAKFVMWLVELLSDVIFLSKVQKVHRHVFVCRYTQEWLLFMIFSMMQTFDMSYCEVYLTTLFCSCFQGLVLCVLHLRWIAHCQEPLLPLLYGLSTVFGCCEEIALS